MSLHRNDHLVASHQSQLHREASEARLAKAARAAQEARLSAASSSTPAPRHGGNLLTGLFQALRGARRDVKVPAPRPSTSTWPTAGS
jgi:hypothetical protein